MHIFSLKALIFHEFGYYLLVFYAEFYAKCSFSDFLMLFYSPKLFLN